MVLESLQIAMVKKSESLLDPIQLLLQLLALLPIGLVGNGRVVGDPLHQHYRRHRELLQVDIRLCTSLVTSSKVWLLIDSFEGSLEPLLIPLELVVAVADVAV